MGLYTEGDESCEKMDLSNSLTISFFKKRLKYARIVGLMSEIGYPLKEPPLSFAPLLFRKQTSSLVISLHQDSPTSIVHPQAFWLQANEQNNKQYII